MPKKAMTFLALRHKKDFLFFYNSIQYAPQIPYQIEREVDQRKLLAMNGLDLIYRIRFWPDTDGYVYIRTIHKHLKRTEMGIRSALYLYRIELGVMSKNEINLCTIIRFCPKRAMLASKPPIYWWYFVETYAFVSNQGQRHHFFVANQRQQR